MTRRAKAGRLWLVWGSSGQYDDYTAWVVCYYADKQLARNHVNLASKEESRISAWRQEHEELSYGIKHEALINKWDRARGASYDTAEYSVGYVDVGSAKEGKEWPS